MPKNPEIGSGADLKTESVIDALVAFVEVGTPIPFEILQAFHEGDSLAIIRDLGINLSKAEKEVLDRFRSINDLARLSQAKAEMSTGYYDGGTKYVPVSEVLGKDFDLEFRAED